MSQSPRRFTDLGPPPRMDWVDLDRIDVEPAYQRELETRAGQTLVAKIAAEWDWMKCPPLMLVEQGKRFVLLDGQHRLAAARRIDGFKKLPAMIYAETTLEQRAKAFIAINADRVYVTPYALHKARVAAGDKAARQLQAVCKMADVAIPAYAVVSSNLKPNETLALAAIRGLIAAHGEAGAVRALKVIRAAWPTTPGQLRALTMKAVAQFLETAAPGTDLQRLAAGLAKTSAEERELAARSARAKEGGTPELHYVQQLQTDYAAAPNAVRPPTANASLARQASTIADEAAAVKKRTADLVKTAGGKAAAPLTRKQAAKLPPARKPLSDDEAASVAAFLETKGATKVEAGGAASGMERVVRWLRAQDMSIEPQCDEKGRARRYKVNGQGTISATELIAMANRYRKLQKLGAFSEALAKDNRHPHWEADAGGVSASAQRARAGWARFGAARRGKGGAR